MRLASGAARRLPRADWFTLFIIAVALAGAALALFRQSGYGVVRSHDSILYISMARSLLAGDGLLAFNGVYITHWPPLTSVLYAVGGLGIIDPFHVPGPMNVAALGATALIVGIWARRRLESRFVAGALVAAVALGVPMTRRADHALPETPFILFATLALFALDRFIERGGRAPFLWAVAFTTAAVASRYTGVFLAFVCVAILLTRQGATLRENARDAALFAIIPFLTLAAWVIRNYLKTGVLANAAVTDKPPSAQVAWINANEMLNGIADWWMPTASLTQEAGAAIGAATLCLAAAAFVWALFRFRARTRFAAILAGFSLIYFAGVAVSSGVSHVFAPGDRYAAPFYIPLILLAAFGIDRVASRLRRSPSRLAGIAAYGTLAALALWTAYSASAGALAAWERANGPGGGWVNAHWEGSETIQYMRERGADETVLTNDEPKGLYINGDHRATYRRLPPDRAGLSDLISGFQDGGAQEETLIVWMHWVDYKLHEYNAADLRGSVGLETLAVLSDGYVFRANPDSPPDDPRRGALLADEQFDIYMDGETLSYVREPCGEDEDMAGGFWLRVAPVFADDLDNPENRHGMNVRNFSLRQYGARFGGKCAAWVNLPDYDIRAIDTSRRGPAGEFRWGTAILTPLSETALDFYRDDYAALSAREPLARGEYDIYMDGGDLAYLKQPCAQDDTLGRFLLSVFPADPDDLPRGAGAIQDAAAARLHQSMNFDFRHYGVIFGGKCMARVPLPDYPVRAVETGRWVPPRDGWAMTVPIPPDGEALARYRQDAAALSALAPLARGEYDIYMEGGDLAYLKAPCSPEDVQGVFLLSAFPKWESDLPADSAARGYESERFGFARYGVMFDGKCLMRRPMPEYPIRAFAFGRGAEGEPDVWRDPIEPPTDETHLERYRQDYADISAREPLARGEYDIYLDGGDIVYLKEPCAQDDALGRFLLSVFPADADDLHPERKAAGASHMGLNFDFGRYGVMFDGKCLVRRALPDFAVEYVETGQWIPGEGGLWMKTVQISLSDDALAAYREEYADLSAREPLARAVFNVYLDGGDIVYLKAPCNADDARGRFLLSVFSADPDDLPPERKAAGANHVGMNFDFGDYGVMFDGKCLVRRVLPDFDVESVTTGQWIPGGGEVWEREIAIGE